MTIEMDCSGIEQKGSTKKMQRNGKGMKNIKYKW